MGGGLSLGGGRAGGAHLRHSVGTSAAAQAHHKVPQGSGLRAFTLARPPFPARSLPGIPCDCRFRERKLFYLHTAGDGNKEDSNK